MGAEDLRYELKAAYPEAVAHQLPAWVARCGFVRQYPSRWVNSIYWDSLALADAQTTQQGHPRRAKLRLRWYGLEETVQAVLEFKYKDGLLGGKRRHEVPGVVCLTWPWRDILDVVLRDAPPVFYMAARMRPRPSTLIRYYRHYYALPDGSIRLTLDQEMRTYPQVFGTRPNLTRENPRRRHTVLELKADRQETARLSRVADRLGLPWSRHSKYASASAAGVG